MKITNPNTIKYRIGIGHSLCIALIIMIHSQVFSQYLDPGSFSSLGTFNPASNVVINMSTRSMTGGVSATGVMSGSILVFTFDSFTLPSGISITFSNVTDNDDKIAFLSKGNMTISGNIYANASASTPGPGGRRGGIGTSGSTSTPEVGQGSGGGQINLDGDNDDGAGGGGFGGAGGAHGYGAPGGSTYGNLAVALDGGSGGARSMYDPPDSTGGGGGGALELGAYGTLTLNSGCQVQAKGGAGCGARYSMCGDDGDGGGSGGGILIHADIVTFNSGASVNANGGNGGHGDNDSDCGQTSGTGDGGGGGGGGGGRIRIAYHTSGTNNGSAVANGGSGGTDPGTYGSYPGVAGSNGVVQFVQDANTPTATPEMNLKQGSTTIADGGSYDFGTKSTGSNTDIVFTIENIGSGDLTLSGSPIISITGTNADQFSVQSQPTSPVSGSGSTTFTIRFSPTSGGAKTAAIAIGNDDSDENPYNLTLNGTATPLIIFVNGENAALNFVQSNAVPPVSNWLCGEFSLAGDITGATLNSVTVTLGGTYDSGDLESTPFQLYASNTNDFSGSSAIGTSMADPGSGSDVTFSGLSDGIPASARYYWVTADISSSATGDDTMNGTIDAAGDLSITSGTLSGSSSYGKLNAGTDASLPVDLSSFSAVCEGQSIILEWVTESETDNLGFILERSVDGESWTTVASYQTNDALKGQGNTSSKTEYSFTDTEVEPETTYEYRLSDVSIDGKVTVYASLSIATDALPLVTAMEKAYPNPFNPSTFIAYHLAENSDVQISVYDMLGRKVQTLFNGRQLAGSYHVYWNGKNEAGNIAPTGTYLIRMQTENTAQVQKVLLMK